MIDYSKGKIYGLRGNGVLYVGSTCDTLSKRKSKHKYDAKTNKPLTSKLCYSGEDEPDIYLIEEFPCSCKEELRKREGYWIDREECVNKKVAGLTREEYFERNKDKIMKYQKEYRENEENKRRKAVIDKAYQEANKEKVRQQRKAYREANKEKVRQQKKEWYEKNKERILAVKKEKYRSG